MDFTMYPISKNRNEFECLYNGVTYYVSAYISYGEPVIEYVSYQDHDGGDHETDNYPESLIEDWLEEFFFDPADGQSQSELFRNQHKNQ